MRGVRHRRPVRRFFQPRHEGRAAPGIVLYSDAGGVTSYRPECRVVLKMSGVACKWAGKPIRCGTDPAEHATGAASAVDALKRHLSQFHRGQLESEGIDIDGLY